VQREDERDGNRNRYQHERQKRLNFSAYHDASPLEKDEVARLRRIAKRQSGRVIDVCDVKLKEGCVSFKPMSPFCLTCFHRIPQGNEPFLFPARLGAIAKP